MPHQKRKPQYKIGDGVTITKIAWEEDFKYKPKHDEWKKFIGKTGIVKGYNRITSARTRKSTIMYKVRFGPGDNWIYSFVDELEKAR